MIVDMDDENEFSGDAVQMHDGRSPFNDRIMTASYLSVLREDARSSTLMRGELK